MEKKKLGPDHYRYVDEMDPQGLEVICKKYVVKQRAAIGLECHEALKSMAATVDADFTDMTGTGDDLSQVEEAA